MGMPFDPVIGEPRESCQHYFYKQRIRVTRKKSIFSEISKFCLGEVGQGTVTENFLPDGSWGSCIIKVKIGPLPLRILRKLGEIFRG